MVVTDTSEEHRRSEMVVSPAQFQSLDKRIALFIGEMVLVMRQGHRTESLKRMSEIASKYFKYQVCSALGPSHAEKWERMPTTVVSASKVSS